MTENELRRHFKNAPESFIKSNAQDCADSPSPSPQPKRPVRHEPLATDKGKEGNLGRAVVRIKSLRTRLLDPDNLCPKYFIDGLRYAGLIRGDSSAEILLEVSQEKVATRKEERTEIEVGPFEPGPVVSHKLVAIRTPRQDLIEQLWSQVSQSWNRPAFDAFMETLSEDDLQQYIKVGKT